jgi:hypothetical protein
MTYNTMTSRTRIRVTFAEPWDHQLEVWHPDDRQSIVNEITDARRLYCQSGQDGPRDTVIPMSNVATVVVERVTT